MVKSVSGIGEIGQRWNGKSGGLENEIGESLPCCGKNGIAVEILTCDRLDGDEIG